LLAEDVQGLGPAVHLEGDWRGALSHREKSRAVGDQGGPDAEGAPCRVAEDRPAAALAQPQRRGLPGGGYTDGVVAGGSDGGEARAAPIPYQRHEELRDGLAVGKRPGGGSAAAPCPGPNRLVEQLAEQRGPTVGERPHRLGAARPARAEAGDEAESPQGAHPAAAGLEGSEV